MRFTLVLGRFTVFDFTLFQINDPPDNPDVVVVHHYNDGDEEEKPDDMFGSRG
jgi:hypothetical protein